MPTKYVGNFVISLRTLATLIQSNGPDRTALVIDQNFEPLLRAALGDHARLICYPRPRGGTTLRDKARQYLDFLRDLRDTRYEKVIDIDGTVLSGRVMRYIRADHKIGPDFAKRPGTCDRLVDVDRESHHCFFDFSLMAAAIGIDVEETSYLLIPSVNVTLPIELPPTDQALVCIHPSATKEYKQWSARGFARLADALTRSGSTVVFVGAGSQEAARISAIRNLMEETAIDAHGRLSLIELVGLCQRADLFIGNDSGPMHLAAASGTTVIALFGPTELIRWQPMADNTHILKGPAPCAPDCQTEDCKRGYQCLGSLTPEIIMDKVTELRPALTLAPNGQSI